MDWAGLTAAGMCAALGLMWLQWRTWSLVPRFNAAVVAAVLVVDALVWVGTGFVIFPFGFLGWKLWLFWAAARWEPVGGLFARPCWPRDPIRRGKDEEWDLRYREPLPWTRGPFTY